MISFAAGMLAGVSPCILPVLPVVFTGWALAPDDSSHPFRARRLRATSVMAGLVISFGVLTAIGSVLISALHLPGNLLRDVGIALLAIYGVSLINPKVEQIIERPFQQFARKSPKGTRSGFFLGLGLGAVFVPCAGPVLATISVLGATHRASLYSLLLSLIFALGAALPLFTLALIGDRFVEKNRKLAHATRKYRPAAGVILLAMAIALAFNLTSPFQRMVPNYVSALQQKIEGNPSVTKALHSLFHSSNNNGSLATCESAASVQVVTTLQKCGAAPDFTGITNWVNTPGGQSISLPSLRGRVVLIDFYTYTCINCQRSLPHVEAWYSRYHKFGLDVIGIQAPEFSFEHVLSNIVAGAHSLGIRYPVAVDNNLTTWQAYSNEYWPAEYLIDANGIIRHVAYGEGGYGSDEKLIRQLLKSANPSVRLPRPTAVADLTPTTQISPETYLGSERSQYLQGSGFVGNGLAHHAFPSNLSLGNYALSGDWVTANQYIQSLVHSQLKLAFSAHNVYLVLGGEGKIQEYLNGRFVQTVKVSGFPTLYTLLSGPNLKSDVMLLKFSSNVRAYDFTFG